MNAGTAQEIVGLTFAASPSRWNHVHETTCSGPADGGSDAPLDSGARN